MNVGTDAPVMADGAGTAALVGGVFMILTAGIPVLFLSGKDKQEDASTRASGLEQGLRSEMGDAAFEESLMEAVDVDEVVAASGDDDVKRGAI